MTKQKVIDSHIHLFAAPHLQNLAWMTQDNKLHGDHRLEEYQEYAKSDRFLSSGVIFVETDMKSGLDEDQWELPIDEYLYIERTVNQQQLQGEGSVNGSEFIKGIIPWGPVPLGAQGLRKYVDVLKERTVVKDNLKLVKGFRYLLQDKPNGTMLEQNFISGLNWLGENDYVFDLGIDIHSRGIQQLAEFAIVDSKTRGVTYIVNHLCKPDFEADSSVLKQFSELWAQISQSGNNSYYIKLSGAFSELTNELASSTDLDLITEKIIPWVKVFLDIFGPKRIIWGSDWPVSTFKFKEGENAWDKWSAICENISRKLGLELNDVFYENTISAYRL